MNGREWSQEDCHYLRELQAFNEPQWKIAMWLGRSISAVKSKASDEGFLQPKRGKWTAEEESIMFWLIANGSSAKSTGNAIGRSARAVRAYLNRIGMSCAAIIEGAKNAKAI